MMCGIARLVFKVIPKSPYLILEARSKSGGGPWSVQLRLWAMPDETGTCMANYSFLSNKAKGHLGDSFRLTLGRVKVATAQLFKPPTFDTDTEVIELDFLESGVPPRRLLH